VPVPYFCYFYISEKLHRKYSRNWTKQNPEYLFFPKRHGVQRRDGVVLGGGRTTPWRGPPTGRVGVWCGPLAHTLMPPFRLYIPLDRKTKRPDQFSTKPTTSHHRRRCEIGRVQKLFPVPCRRGDSPLKAFFITMVASGVMCE
jgi:hypothetical protein